MCRQSWLLLIKYPYNKVTWLLCHFCAGSSCISCFGNDVCPRKEMIQLGWSPWSFEAIVISFKELKQKSKAVYGLVKSILSMDHNADLYNGTGIDLYPGGRAEQLLEDLKAAKNLSSSSFIIDEGAWCEVVSLNLEQKVKDGLKSNSFMTISAVWQPWLGTTTNGAERWFNAHKFNKSPNLTVAYITTETVRSWSLMVRSAIQIVSI